MLRSKFAPVLLPLLLALAAVGCGGAPGETYDEQGEALTSGRGVVAAASVADEVMGVRERLVRQNDQITDAVTIPAFPTAVNGQLPEAAKVLGYPTAVNDQITDSVTQ